MIVYEPKNIVRILNSLAFYVLLLDFSAEQFTLFKTGLITKKSI